MKKLLLLTLCALMGFTAKAQVEEAPLISLTIEVDKENVENNSRNLVFAAAEAGHKLQIDWGNGTLVETEEITVDDGWGTTTTVTGTVCGEGNVKIYGSGIVIFGCDSHVKAEDTFYPHVTALNVTNATELKELTCNTNSLTTLDVSKNTALTKLSCYNNPISELDLKNNTELTSLDAKNMLLTAIDLSANTKLGTLYLNQNAGITAINLEANTELKNLYLIDCSLTTLDVSKNTLLGALSVNNNKLTALDVTACEGLKTFFCMGNQISDLKMSKVSSTLNVSKNNLTLATLPALPEGMKVARYTYAPQNDMEIPATLTAGEVLDLSAQTNLLGVLAEAQATTFTWIAKGDTLKAGIDYTEENGKFTFLTEQDSVYCVMTSAAFPKFTGSNQFKTTATAVKAIPAIAISLTIEVDKENAENNSRNLVFAAAEAGHKLYIDWGNGTLVETEEIGVDDGWTTTTVTGTVCGEGQVKIYGSGIVVFEASSHIKAEDTFYPHVTAIDVTNATELTSLNVYTNSLTTLDVSKNTKLAKLSCYNNPISELDLKNNTELTSLDAKNMLLTAIDLSANTKLGTLYLNQNAGITAINLETNTELKNLYLIDCSLTTLDVSKNTLLGALSVNNNKLTALDVTACEGLKTLFAMGNQISDLKMGKVSSTLNVSKNNLTLATLPALPEGMKVARYTYAPQNDMEIPATLTAGEVLDLSAQTNLLGVLAEAQATTFTWIAKSDTLKAGTDYTEENGKFTFLTEQDSVYCVMTSEAFPKFTGSSAFKTTPMTISVPVGIQEMNADAVKVYATEGQIVVNGLTEATAVKVFTTNGQLVAAITATGNCTFSVKNGFYIVVAGTTTQKVNVQ